MEHTTPVAIVDAIRLSSPTLIPCPAKVDPEFRQCANLRPLPSLPGSFSQQKEQQRKTWNKEQGHNTVKVHRVGATPRTKR